MNHTKTRKKIQSLPFFVLSCFRDFYSVGSSRPFVRPRLLVVACLTLGALVATGACFASNYRLVAVPPWGLTSLRIVGRPERIAWEPRVWGRGELRMEAGYPVVFLRGSARERGEQYGHLLAPQVKLLLDHYLAVFLADGMDTARRDMESFKRWVPADLAEELSGIAAGAGASYEDVLLAHTFLDSYPSFHCTTFAASGPAVPDHRMLVGRNLDFPALGVLQDYGLVAVHQPDEGFPFALITWPGMAGAITGMNSRGVVLAMMVSLDGQQDNTGVPTILLFRQALQRAANVEEAERIIREADRPNSANLMVADPERAVVLEITPDHVVTRSQDDRGLVYAANYFQSPELICTEPCKRYRRMEACAAEAAGRLDVPAIRGILAQVYMAGINVQAMVFEPADLRVHLSMGQMPAAKGEYRALDLGPLFAAQLEEGR